MDQTSTPKGARKREWLGIAPRASVAAILVAGALYGLAPIISPDVTKRGPLSVFIPDLSKCAGTYVSSAELWLNEADKLVARIFFTTTKPEPCEVMLEPIINEDQPLDIAISAPSSPKRKVLTAIREREEILLHSFFGVPALIKKFYKTEIQSSEGEFIYTYQNSLNHRTYSKSLLDLNFHLGAKSMAPFPANLKIPIIYDVSIPDTGLKLSIDTVLEQSINLKVSNGAEIKLFLDNLLQAQRRDSLILLYGALFGTGAALMAEALASSIKLYFRLPSVEG